jgi:hypothetical protein
MPLSLRNRKPYYFACLGILSLAWAVARASGVEIKRPASRPAEREVARRLDRLLLHTAGAPAALPALADDETFLRRVSLDLTGKLPTPAEVEAFVVDCDPAKRARLIDRLLTTENYAINWGRYWRDAITYCTPASGNYLRWQLFDRWLTDQIRSNRPWNEIVTALVTAEGVNDECAPVNYLTAQFGNPIEIAATTCRVFLGVQLQCAQCHDAKTEPWKREQFHEMVAFFGRARLVQHKDVGGRGTPYAIEGRADGQYSMTDKKNPVHLIAMTPRFLTGQSVPTESSDAERRAALARYLTSPANPWFARAYINRMWNCLMGWGFFSTVNDISSAPPVRYPEVLDLLAADWKATGYDPRWLFRTLANTEAYQRRFLPQALSEAMVPLAVCPTRLRPEQIFEEMVKALGFNENDRTIPAPAPSSAPAVARHSGLRHMIYQAFKADPSLPPEEIHGTIPQALLMMNSVLVNTFTAARSKGFLTEALAKNMPDDQVILALYERTLARKPRSEEMQVCQRYLKKVPDRKEALEDIFWSLVNSTEFLTKK